jgi:hypothetical protein
MTTRAEAMERALHQVAEDLAEDYAIKPNGCTHMLVIAALAMSPDPPCAECERLREDVACLLKTNNALIDENGRLIDEQGGLKHDRDRLKAIIDGLPEPQVEKPDSQHAGLAVDRRYGAYYQTRILPEKTKGGA